MIEKKTEYSPDYVSPPGDTLEETLQSIGMTQVELAIRTGRPTKTINQILKGKASIEPETAIQFERALGIPAEFWIARQRRYDEFLARQAEQTRLSEWIEWTQNFKFRKMVKFGWLSDSKTETGKLVALLNFFGVASPDAWNNHWQNTEVNFRKSKAMSSDTYALAAWLRQGELQASAIRCHPYDSAIFQNSLLDLREFTRENPDVFCRKMVESCAKGGVALVFVPELPKTASGATYWLNPHKALIQLSLRYHTNDHFWFTFFHEAAHILKHHKKAIFIEQEGYSSPEEDEANKFASDFLISDNLLQKFIDIGVFTVESVTRFADLIGIAPGIVVGRLQHDGHIPFSALNGLKQKLIWTADFR